MFGLGGMEIVAILVIALIFIGPKKLPELAKGIGKGFREFQRAKDGLMDQVKDNNPLSDIHNTDFPRDTEDEKKTQERLQNS